MKIGELAGRVGTSTRMLRYYEAQGLLTARRSANGYRSYDDGDVERVRTIIGLLRSGLSSRLVRVVLTAQDDPASWGTACDLEFSRLLGDELDAIDEKIACLTRSRAAVRACLDRSASTV